jgi:hypothetical protein
MAGLAPPIHAFIFDFAFKTWMPATSTRMTVALAEVRAASFAAFALRWRGFLAHCGFMTTS